MLGTQAKWVRKLLTFLASCGGVFKFARRDVCRSAVAIACAVVAAAALGACGGSSGSGAIVDLPSTGSTAALSAQATPAFGVTDAVSGSRSAAPLSLVWPKGAPALGDLLIACVESQYAATPQSPIGWTALYSTSLNTFGTALFYKNASANESASVIFKIASPYNVSAAMIRVSGAATGAPLWSHAVGKTASLTTAPIVPNVLGMLPLACFGGVNATSFSVAAGWKPSAVGTGAYLTTIEQRQETTTDLTTRISVSTTATGSQSNNNAYQLLVAPARASSGGVSLSPATVAFSGIAVAAQTVVATQAGNTSFSVTSQNCSGIATISSAHNGQFTLTPIAVGACAVIISGSGGASASLPVTITTTALKLH